MIVILLLTLGLVACNDKPAEVTEKVTDKASATVAPEPKKAEVPVVASATTDSDESDEEDGAKLHQEKCVECHVAKHDAAFYQRKDRKISSYPKLQQRVIDCDAQLGLSMFDTEMIAVGKYLNDNYYKFSQ